MKKIQTVFERDWDGDRSRVLDQVVPGCEWVLAGEGVATKKYDGTAVMVEYGVVYRRHEVRAGKTIPAGFREVDDDQQTGKLIGWVPLGDGPENKWHWEGVNNAGGIDALSDGTYELVGPKVQGNPEHYSEHMLIPHAEAERYIVPRNYEGMKELLGELDVEGFVFKHEDGRMAKIKGKDFGLKRSRLPENVAT